MDIDLEYIRDVVVELFNVADDKIDEHILVKRFKELQTTNPKEKDMFFPELLVIHTISKILGVKEYKITQSSRFREDLGADSLDLVELVMAFEDITGSRIADDQARQINTVGAAIQLVSSKFNDELLGKLK